MYELLNKGGLKINVDKCAVNVAPATQSNIFQKNYAGGNSYKNSTKVDISWRNIN